MPQNTGVGIYNYIAVTFEIFVDIFEYIYWLFLLLRIALRRSYDFCCNRTRIESREREILERCSSVLSKKPQHIAVIVGPTAAFMSKHVYERLFRYALETDIECISLYDTRPDVERKESATLLAQVTTPSDMHVEHVSKNHTRWTTKKPAVLNGYTKNGHVPNGSTHTYKEERNKTLEIFEFTTHDNFKPIAEVCRKLFSSRETSQMQLMIINNRNKLMEVIDKELSKCIFGSISESKGFRSEPEICIIFNAFLCTYRMLPWHTRFTEFFHFKTGWEFDANAFADVLYRYARCEQRWGK